MVFLDGWHEEQKEAQHSGIILYTGFRASKFVAYWPCNLWQINQISSFFIVEMGIIREAALTELLGRVNEFIHVES